MNLDKDNTSEALYPTDSEGNVISILPFCSYCGEIVEDQKYCHNCGKKLLWPNENNTQ